jgi:hypothetical protein
MQQLRKSAIAYECLVVLASLCACSRPEPRSPIIGKVEQAGSGNLTAVSKDGMREWLGKHKDVAYQVDEMCKPVRQKATAEWAESTERRQIQEMNRIAPADRRGVSCLSKFANR